MEELNALIDKNLELISKSKDGKIQTSHFLNIKDDQITNRFKSNEFADKMIDENLISRNGDYSMITKFGTSVQEYGGWLKYLEQKKNQDRKDYEYLKDKTDQEDRKRIAELTLAENSVKDYNITKWMARVGFGLSVILVIYETIRLINGV